MFKELLDAILRVFFGHNAVDNTIDWKKSHDKARTSRKEVDDIISQHQNKK
jgi:hypothetical protein